MECKALMLAEQRGELRKVCRQNGAYLKSLIIGASPTFEEGPATILNESLSGALLQMPRPFYAGDIIEVHLRRRLGQKLETTLFDVRWSHPLEQRSESHGYVTGCRRLFTIFPQRPGNN